MKPTKLLSLVCLFAGQISAAHFHRGGQVDASYDYVVVGGGTSGLVVASRLTENPDVEVLVIEVGDLDQDEPGVLVPGIPTPQNYWRTYNSTPQAGLNDRVNQLYTGEVVGGGTVVNELGNPGWGWEGLLPYFKKMENYTPAPVEIQAQYPASPDLSPHGTSGPVGSSYPPFDWAIVKHFFRGWQSLGIWLNAQSNDGKAVGALHSTLSLTAWNQTRSSASSAYYKGAPSERPNFSLLTGHMVTRIVFDGKRACGVEYRSVSNNSTQSLSVSARHEVIVAAGAARSPQLLQLSGIGPKALLARFNISVLEDLPGVGYNFQDQPSYYMILQYNNWTLPTPDWLDSEIANHTRFADQQLDLYYKVREGAYTTTFESGCDVAFLPLQNFTDDYERIISNARLINVSRTAPNGIDQTVLAGQEAQQNILLRHYASFDTAVQETAYSGSSLLIFVNLKPLSRGSILVNSSEPFAEPLIDFGTFSHPTDLEIMLAALKKNRDLLQTPAMQELGTIELVPGTNITSDIDLRAALREGTLSSWQHPVGTCAMLPKDLGGVVDARLNVFGVQGLRIVDASIMPVIPASHISSTVYAVAEKAVDLIKEDRYAAAGRV